nr:T-cell surface glycoprotein CD1a-like [Anolis sagrei ordinatus]
MLTFYDCEALDAILCRICATTGHEKGFVHIFPFTECVIEVEGRRVSSGETWTDSTDSCVSCTCNLGHIECHIQECMPLLCQDGLEKVQVPGKCCAECQDPGHSCSYQGQTLQSNDHWQVDECTTCTCLSGEVHCRTERCPPTACAAKPEVMVTRKEEHDGMETLICHVRGFYPKDIDIDWTRGGEVWQQDVFHGLVSPNSDGTYYTWRSIKVDPKEREHYKCHVEHDALQNPVDVAWKVPASKLGLIGCVVVVLLLLIAVIAVYFKKRQHRKMSGECYLHRCMFTPDG